MASENEIADCLRGFRFAVVLSAAMLAVVVAMSAAAISKAIRESGHVENVVFRGEAGVKTEVSDRGD